MMQHPAHTNIYTNIFTKHRISFVNIAIYATLYSAIIAILLCAGASRAIAEDGSDIQESQTKEITESIDHTSDETIVDTRTTIHPSAIVRDIEFEGLKRTRRSYLLAELSDYIGIKASELDKQAMETDLQRIGLFDEIHISLQPSGKDAVVHVSLKEKWSIIPIPMFSYVDEIMAGLFLMDMNAFGANNKAVIGGFGSKSKVRGVFSFSTPSIVGSPGISFYLSGAKDDDAVQDADGYTILKYSSVNYTLGSNLHYKFTPVLEAGIGISYQFEDNTPKQYTHEKFDSKRESSVQALSLEGSFKYEKSNWNGWFMSSLRASISANAALVNSDIISPSVSVNLSYQRPVFVDRLRYLVHAGGYYAYNSLIPMYKKARSVGADILPSKFMSPAMIAGGTGFEVGIYRFKWASFSVGAQYQVIYARQWETGDGTFRHGWSSALNVNLSKIAFPAFSFNMTQDMTNMRFRYAFGVGMSM